MDSRVQNVFREVFDNPDLTITDATAANNLAGWDSLAQVKLIIMLEEEFGINFTTNEVAEMKSVGDLKASLKRKGIK